MILTLVGSYLGGVGGAYVHFREEERALWWQAMGLAVLWPWWLVHV